MLNEDYGRLTLSRAKNETITIGKSGDVLDGPIVVVVVRIQKSRVYLGIKCQKSINIYRTELGPCPDCRDDRPATNRTESD
jgi:sRNA-binding carbon storage regulator CsrA